MKRMRINAVTLAGNVPPPSGAFAEDIMARLRAMAEKEEKPMKRKAIPAALIAALLIILLAATALAVSLLRSSRADAVTRARQALIDQYGLSVETLGIFSWDAGQDSGVWTVSFISSDNWDEQPGDYTVVLAPGQAPKASWTHDDVDPALWQGEGLEAPVWGQEQLLALLAQKEAERQASADFDWEHASFAEKAGFRPEMRIWVSADQPPLMFTSLVPGPEDITEDQALELAKRAARDVYGIEPGRLEAFDITVDFAEPQGGGARQYVVIFNRIDPEWESVIACIASPTGEALSISWNVPASRRTLPDGPLDAYAKAVEEFIQAGSLQTRMAADKADILRRAAEAGFTDLTSQLLPYDMPGEGDLPEEEAVALAANILEDAYGVPQEALGLFTLTTSLVGHETRRDWIIEYQPWGADDSDWGYIAHIPEKLGSYIISLNAQTGEKIDARWDMEASWDNGTYGAGNWAGAPAYHGSLLSWVAELRQAIDAVKARNPQGATIYDYSMEDIAAYDTAYRGAGFDAGQYYHGLPGPEELTQEEALALARQALMEEMAVTREQLGGAEVLSHFSVEDPEQHKWLFSFFLMLEGITVDHGVAIDAGTGEILLTNTITGGNG